MGAESIDKLRIEIDGLVRYHDALRRQEDAVERALHGKPTLFILEHPHVVTFGVDMIPADEKLALDELVARGIDVTHIGRRGKGTYHGPGQLLVYIVKEVTRAERVQHVSELEQAAVRFLRGMYEIDTRSSDDPFHPGVLYGEQKIAAVGVEFRTIDNKIITLHGAAINLNTDLSFFDFIYPCGSRGNPMTSVASVRGAVCMDAAKNYAAKIYGNNSLLFPELHNPEPDKNDKPCK